MKIKIQNVLKVNPVFNGVSKQSGKPYTVHKWSVMGSLDGATDELLELSAMTDVNPQPGTEFEVEEKTYNGNVSYSIKNATGSGQKWDGKKQWSKPVYTLTEYDALFDHAIDKVTEKMGGITPETIPLISTYIISAVNSSVKINGTSEKPADDGSIKKDYEMFNEISEKVKNNTVDKAEWLKVLAGRTLKQIPADELSELYSKFVLGW